MKKEILLSGYCKIADIHASRLEGARDHAVHVLLKRSEGLSSLSLSDIAYIEMMALRFHKLESLLSKKIFAVILGKLGEGVSLLHRLNIIKVLGYVDDANWWMNLRDTSTRVLHDNQDSSEMSAESLKLFIMKSQELLDFWRSLKVKLESMPKLNQGKS